MDKQRDECIAALLKLTKELPRVVVSAAIDATGKLEPVSGVAEKLKASFDGYNSERIHVIGLAEGQCTHYNEPLKDHLDFAHRYDSKHKQPIVAAGKFADLAIGLEKTYKNDERFGRRLVEPSSFGDQHYRAADYIPRPWLNEEIGRFVRDHRSGYLVLTCDGIWGKSAFALNWWRRSQDGSLPPDLPQLKGAAFIRIEEANGEYVQPQTIVESLEAEIRWSCNLPRAGMPIAVPSAGNRDDIDIAHVERFAAFLKNDLQPALKLGHKVICLLDGVDEIWGPAGTRPSTQVLPGAFDPDLPDGVYVVLLSRPGEHLLWKRGDPRVCLTINPADAQWQAQNEAHLAEYINQRADDLGKGDATGALIRGAKDALLRAAGGHLYYLIEVLHDCEGIADRPAALQEKLANLPQGVGELLARRVVRRVLRRADHPLPTLACLALVACLREPVPTVDLLRLLFDEAGKLASGPIDLSASCGDALFWADDLHRTVFCDALHLGAECFIGGGLEDLNGLPRTTGFWHPLVRDAIRAAWRLACESGKWKDEKAIVAAMAHLTEAPEHEAERPLHLRIAAAASRFWPRMDGRTTAGEGCPRYALSWAPWHAIRAGDADALSEVAETLTDPVFLRAVYDRLDSEAHHPLDITLEAAWGEYPALRKRLFDVRRTLAQHDRHLVQRRSDKRSVLPVAAALYNDLGGRQDPGDASWRQQLAAQAAASCGLLRRRPGELSAYYRFLPTGPCKHALAISPCGRWMAVPVDNKILLFRLESGGFRVGKPVTLSGHSREVHQVAFSAPVAGPDGRQRLWLASSAWEDDTVGLCILDAEGDAAGKSTTPLSGRSGAVFQVAFSAPVAAPEGGQRLWLASVSRDGVGLCVLDAESDAAEMAMTPLSEHSNLAYRVAFSAPVAGPDGRQRLWLASGSWDGIVDLCVLDAEGNAEGNAMTPLSGRSGRVIQVAFSAPMTAHGGGQRLWLASASPDGTVGLCVLDANGDAAGKAMTPLTGHSQTVNQVAFSAQMAQPGVNQVAFSAPVAMPGGGQLLWLASASPDGTVGLCVLDANGDAAGKAMTPLTGHSQAVNQVAFSAPVAMPGGEQRLWLASASRDGVGLCVLDANGDAAGKAMTPLSGHSGWVNQVVFSAPVAMPEGGQRLWLASAAAEGTDLCVLDAEGDAAEMAMTRLSGYSGKVLNYVVFSAPVTMPEGGQRLWLASGGSNDGTFGLCVLDAEGDAAEKAMTPLTGHSNPVNHVAFSAPVAMPGGGQRLWLASSSWDKTVGLRVLDAEGDAAEMANTPVVMCQAVAVSSGGTQVNPVAFSAPVAMPGGGQRLWLASSSWNDTVGLCVLDAEGDATGNAMTPLSGHSGRVKQVTFSAPVAMPEGGQRLWLASASTNGTVGLCELDAEDYAAGKAMTRLEGHSGWVNQVAFSAPVRAGKLLLASSSVNEIILWNVLEGRILARASFAATGEHIRQIRWSDDNRLLYVTGHRSNQRVNLTLIVPEHLLDDSCS